MKTDDKELLKAMLKDKHLLVASHSEPYTHYREEGTIKMRSGTGGVVAALDPLLAYSNGTWVSVGSGEVDRQVADNEGKVRVPDKNGYVLKRIFITKAEREAYLDGVSNGALWPLAHAVYVRPRFVDSQWATFKKVNRKFAIAIAKETRHNSIVWIHDFQLCMVPRYLRKLRPDISIAFFWHIPWPGAQVFSICPWAGEILESLLCTDLVGMHTPQYAYNFLESVDRELEARVDKPDSIVYYRKKPTAIRANPISIDYGAARQLAGMKQSAFVKELFAKNGLDKAQYAVGVDRMDYIKGLPEKIKAVDAFLRECPKYIGKFSLLQIASPTRVHQSAYQRLAREVAWLAGEVNGKYDGMAKKANPNWKPIVLVERQIDKSDVYAIYAGAKMCMVTSLHDGLNLVCKEFVGGRKPLYGTLLLSKFAGASSELAGARKINPYSMESVVNAMRAGFEQSAKEEHRRMVLMARQIEENDVYHWSFGFLRELQAAYAQSRWHR